MSEHEAASTDVDPITPEPVAPAAEAPSPVTPEVVTPAADPAPAETAAVDPEPLAAAPAPAAEPAPMPEPAVEPEPVPEPAVAAVVADAPALAEAGDDAGDDEDAGDDDGDTDGADASDEESGAAPGPALGPDGLPRKKRRRGKRGGRNRNKKPAGAPGADAEDDGDDADEPLPNDWNDVGADGGYTSDDISDAAREDAGLASPKPFLTPSVPPPAPRAADAVAADAPAQPQGQSKQGQAKQGQAKQGQAKQGQNQPGQAKQGQNQPGQAKQAQPKGQGANQAGKQAAPQDSQPDGEQDDTEGVVPGEGQTGTGAKKRRRRGGRNRNKKPASAGAPSAGYVEGAGGHDDFDGASVLEQLDEATLERRRGLQRKGRPTGRYVMVVHTHGPSGRAHVAVLEGRNLVEHYVSEPQDDERNIDGNIYLGKVQNVQPGMEAAFVDIGTQKNAILYRGDVRHDVEHDGDRPKIERMLRNGQSILVQVTKNPIAHKGARLTQEVSLAGRFVVVVPDEPTTYGISKRLPDDERKRLRRVLDRLRPANAGLIVRTAAEGATEDELERDMRRLQFQWEQIDSLRKTVKPGTLLYKEPPLAIRVIREEFTKEYRAIVLDDKALYDEVKAYVDAVAPELADRIEFYDEAAEGLPLFERYHVHEQLHKALDRKVWLPSGGSLVIERTEALTVIDVNTAKNVGKSNLEETVYRNNLEAAEVIARELRLRDIGGIIVIDFIDMEVKANRENVERTFREALARDKTRTQIYPISELGLLEMTRKRVSEGLVESFSQTCEHCEGRGILVDHSLYEE